MTASSLPVVNILAVAILLAAIAQVRPGSIAQVSGPAALAATALAVFRLVCDGSAAAWTFTNTVGRVEGLWAGWLTGRPLLIGASFGGVDFLVLMAALTAAWLIATPRPRIGTRRMGHAVHRPRADRISRGSGLQPRPGRTAAAEVIAKHNDISHLGIWTWGNAIRTLLPWNLPVLAAVFHSAVAVGMFRLTAWQRDAARSAKREPTRDSAAAEGKRRNRSLQGGPALPHDWLNSAMNWRRFGPAGLLIVAAVAMTLSPVKPDLKGRRIVAYDDGATDWSTTDPGTVPPGRLPRYGLLPALVESLGGEFIRSRDLADADLQDADVLIVLPPRSAANAAAAEASIPGDIRKPDLEVRLRRRPDDRRRRAGDEPGSGRECSQRPLGADRDVLPRRHRQFADASAGKTISSRPRMPPRPAATRGGATSASIARLPSACRGPPDRCWWAAGPGTNWAPIPTGPRPCPIRRAIIWATWSLRPSRTWAGERWWCWALPPA